MPEAKIIIKSVRKAPRKITIRRNFLSSSDLKSLTKNIIRLNSHTPLQQSTLKDLFEQTSKYMNQLQSERSPLIKIKNIRLFRGSN